MIGSGMGAASAELAAICGLAGMLGLMHTIAGPDHYVPFIAMARVGRWSYRRTVLVSTLCGVGHVLGSVLLGAAGIAIGMAVAGLEYFEALRGDVAAWLLLGFGLGYAVWGYRRALSSTRPGDAGGTANHHEHEQHAEHARLHGPAGASLTPWILFTIFVFGPCEPLIPVLMYPAAQRSSAGVAAVAIIFAVSTIGTMLAVVTVGYFGLARVGAPFLSRFAHVGAGVALATCGSAMILGL